MSEDAGLHFDDLGLGVGEVCDLDAFLDGRRVDFLILAADEEAGQGQQLQVLDVERQRRLLAQHVVE